MNSKICSYCEQEKPVDTDFYCRPDGQPFSKCKKCHNQQRRGPSTKNIGFVGLPTTVQDRVRELYKQGKLTTLVRTLQKEYPDLRFTYGKVQAWHNKKQITF